MEQIKIQHYSGEKEAEIIKNFELRVVFHKKDPQLIAGVKLRFKHKWCSLDVSPTADFFMKSFETQGVVTIIDKSNLLILRNLGLSLKSAIKIKLNDDTLTKLRLALMDKAGPAYTVKFIKENENVVGLELLGKKFQNSRPWL